MTCSVEARVFPSALLAHSLLHSELNYSLLATLSKAYFGYGDVRKSAEKTGASRGFPRRRNL